MLLLKISYNPSIIPSLRGAVIVNTTILVMYRRRNFHPLSSLIFLLVTIIRLYSSRLILPEPNISFATLTKSTPKCLIKVKGVPILEHWLVILEKIGVGVLPGNNFGYTLRSAIEILLKPLILNLLSQKMGVLIIQKKS